MKMNGAAKAMWLVVILSLPACAAGFYEARTPSGVRCADMPVLPLGQDAALQDHVYRLGAVSSPLRARNTAARIEALRRQSCRRGGDLVMEVVLSGVAARYKTSTFPARR